MDAICISDTKPTQLLTDESFVYLGIRIARGSGIPVSQDELHRARHALREAHAF